MMMSISRMLLQVLVAVVIWTKKMLKVLIQQCSSELSIFCNDNNLLMVVTR